MEQFYTLETKTDEQLIDMIKDGNEDALNILIDRYQKFVRMNTNKYFLIGSDSNDVFQEGMIGLYLAIKNYSPDKETTFKTFAKMCIDRQLISALKSANRQKYNILNNAISINSELDDDTSNSNEMITVVKNSNAEDPLDIILDAEYYKKVKEDIYSQLSNKEKNVLDEYLEGKSYAEIAQKLECNTKSVDTALSRIKKKANRLHEEIDANFN